ncbi:PTH11-like integral membrane protein [Aspergillus floccosus]
MDDKTHNWLLPRSPGDGAARGERALVVTAVLTGFAILIVGMRLFARAGLMKFMGREDWTILVSLVFAVVYLALVCAEVHFGLGMHKSELTDYQFKQQLKTIRINDLQRLWAAIPFYNASLCTTKFSILFQYLRIFPDKRFRLACYIVMSIVATYGTWAVVSAFVNCVPVARFWDPSVGGSCMSFEAVWFFNASMNIVTDITLLIMPMPLLSHLHLPRMQKFALMGVFAIGILVVITSILRLKSLKEVASATDTSWSNVGAAYWTAAECNVAIICACLPFLRPLISCLFPKILSTNSYNHYTRNPTTTGRSRATRHKMSQLYSQDRELGLYSIDVKSGQPSPTHLGGGIEVVTEMIQETSNKQDESTSQRRLVMDSA